MTPAAMTALRLMVVMSWWMDFKGSLKGASAYIIFLSSVRTNIVNTMRMKNEDFLRFNLKKING
jgi:hypothetical protein